MTLLDEIRAASRQRAAGPVRTRRHSSIYEFFWSNFDGLTADLCWPATPDWLAVTERLKAAGLVDGNGNPPRPETVRLTWWRVRRDKAGRRPGRIQRDQKPRPSRAGDNDLFPRVRPKG